MVAEDGATTAWREGGMVEATDGAAVAQLEGGADEGLEWEGPLYTLTHKDISFIWTEACKKSFTWLKSLLTEAPILAFPNFS